MTQHIVVIPCQLIGPIFKGQEIQEEIYSWISCPLKMGPIGCPETSARNYGNTLRHNSEERGSHLLSGGCLKSQIFILFIF
jgi:hypothetical protein